MKPASALHPWSLPELTKSDVYALKALAAGKANEGQQKAALDLIIRRLADTYDQPFRPGSQDGDRATCFAAGKMFVGQMIIRATNMTGENIRNLKEDQL